MAPNCGGGCRRGKAAHAGAGAVAGFLVCLVLVWVTGGCGRSSSVSEEEVMLGQFNLSTTQLQTLVSLLLSTEVLCLPDYCAGLLFSTILQFC
jgi:histidine kinase 2/3/4 (cytokinin receptor)